MTNDKKLRHFKQPEVQEMKEKDITIKLKRAKKGI